MFTCDSKKFTLADVLNLKSGDTFYYNYKSLSQSEKCVFSHIVHDPYGLRVAYAVKLRSGEYYMRKSYLTDCGVLPYKNCTANEHIGSDGFNKWNCLTKEPLYRVS